MKIYPSCNDMRNVASSLKKEGKTISFVPTMGNLHEGHLQLVHHAQQISDYVVVSIFVNQLQFGENEDYDLYPRTMEADIEKLTAEGADILFCPTDKEIYPNGFPEQTVVTVPTMTNVLCGASRPGHFTGVTTIVAKLFNIVQADKAIFGLKDYQQLAVIKKMVEDLYMPVKIIAAPIARAADGLALSSRNGYLTDEERQIAPAVYQILCETSAAITTDGQNYQELEEQAKGKLTSAGLRPDYYSIRHAKTLEPATTRDKALVIVAAAYLGQTRLIDNVTLTLD